MDAVFSRGSWHHISFSVSGNLPRASSLHQSCVLFLEAHQVPVCHVNSASLKEQGPQKWLDSWTEQVSSGNQPCWLWVWHPGVPQGEAEHAPKLLDYIFTIWKNYFYTWQLDSNIFWYRVTGKGRAGCGGDGFPKCLQLQRPQMWSGLGQMRNGGNDLGASWTLHCLSLKKAVAEPELLGMRDWIFQTDVLDISAVIISSLGCLYPRQLSINVPCGSLPTAPRKELRLCPANYLPVLLNPEGRRGWGWIASLFQSPFISQSTTIKEPFWGKCLFHSLWSLTTFSLILFPSCLLFFLSESFIQQRWLWTGFDPSSSTY